MKKFSKILALLLALAMVFGFAACGDKTDGDGDKTANSDLKIGVILLHDESIGYDKAHIDGVKAGVAANGLSESQIVWKKAVPESAECADAAKALVADGCDIIFSDSYGHQDFMLEVAEEFPNVTFVSMTGDKANNSKLPNYKNAFTSVFESRYVSGVVAGMKIKQLLDDGTLTPETQPASFDENGNVKIGYVGAFNYAEVVSGYTAFYLGAKSVVENVVMNVEYTASWANESSEATAAEKLVADGCVIIGQHADTTGAPSAVEKLNKSGKICYSVGYNISMLEAAPTAALTSASNNWGVFYTYAIKCMLDGEELTADWSAGYAKDAVKVTELGASCAPGTAEKVAEVEAAIKEGKLHVFDTSKFTVKGEKQEHYTYDFSTMNWATGEVVFEGEKIDVISNGYFHESEYRAAPYFDLRIDGINEGAMPQ